MKQKKTKTSPNKWTKQKIKQKDTEKQQKNKSNKYTEVKTQTEKIEW